MTILKHFGTILLTLLCCLQYSKPEETNIDIKYELSVTTPEYTYEKSTHNKKVITSQNKAFSITVLSDFPTLRQGMLDISPDTYYFWMDGHNLEEIVPGAFDNQNITEEIRLSMNKLSVIKTGTFKNLKIKKLDLSNNKITHVEENAITDLPNLWKVRLGQNKIAQFHDNSFVNTPKMWTFEMINNKLTTLGKKWFNFMKKNDTVIVWISNNKIEEIDPQAFAGITLWNLILDHNKLKHIPEEVFTKNKLKLLSLANNQLEDLPQAFFGQKDLMDVFITGNPLRCDVQAKLKKFSEEVPFTLKYDTHNC